MQFLEGINTRIARNYSHFNAFFTLFCFPISMKKIHINFTNQEHWFGNDFKIKLETFFQVNRPNFMGERFIIFLAVRRANLINRLLLN